MATPVTPAITTLTNVARRTTARIPSKERRGRLGARPAARSRQSEKDA